MLYATALKEAVDEYGLEEAKSNGSLIVKKMWNRTISGLLVSESDEQIESLDINERVKNRFDSRKYWLNELKFDSQGIFKGPEETTKSSKFNSSIEPLILRLLSN